VSDRSEAIARGWLLAWAAAAFGCAHAAGGGAGEDALRVEEVRARFTPGDRADFEIDFAVENRTGAAAAVTGIQWEVWLGGRWFAAGTLALSEAVPAREVRRFTATLPVVFRRVASDRPEPTSIEIGVRGHLLFGADGHVERLAFQDRRRIDAANLPPLGGSIDDR
jgi:hypothetical protein